jgi:hypothetical protein
MPRSKLSAVWLAGRASIRCRRSRPRWRSMTSTKAIGFSPSAAKDALLVTLRLAVD